MISLSSLGRLKYVSHTDPALDKDHADYDFEKFKETGDAKYIPVRDGCQPSTFDLVGLKRPQFIHCASQPNEMLRAIEAVAYGLKGCDNVAIDGQVTIKHKKSELGERVDNEVLDRLFRRFPLMSELAARILDLSQAHPTSGQG